MYCKNCGAPVEEGQSFCSNCGQKQEPVMQDLPTIQQPAHPMKWFKFLIYFALWAAFVFSMLGGIALLFPIFDGDNRTNAIFTVYPLVRFIFLVEAIGILAIGSFALYTRFRLAQFRKNGPMCVLALYAANLVLAVISHFGSQYLAEIGLGYPGDITDLIINMISMVLMIVLNKKYFDKRAELFVKP